jgi:hypothetical protein
MALTKITRPKIVSTALLLGPIVFRQFEIPLSINFGGRQRLAIHRLANGGRVVDALGPDEADVKFSGIFTGTDAALRAIELDGLRASGVVLPLTWSIFAYGVVIKAFSADFRNDNWIPYSIRCVVCDSLQSVLTNAAVSLVTAPPADLQQAAAIGALDAETLRAVQPAMVDTGTPAAGSAEYARTVSSLGMASSRLLSQRSVIDGAAVDITDDLPPRQATQAIAAAAARSHALWATTISLGLVDRALSRVMSGGG